MGTLLKQTELILKACVALDEQEPTKRDFIDIVFKIKNAVAEGVRVDPYHIDELINLACYLSDKSAGQRDRIIGLIETFERQQNIHIVASTNEPKRECVLRPHSVLGA